MRKVQLVVPTAGVDGSATGSATTERPYSGRVVMVNLDYSATQAATTDVTITASDPTVTILSKANSATNSLHSIKMAVHLNTTAATISNEYVEGVPLDGYINVAVAQADDAESVTVTLWIAEA